MLNCDFRRTVTLLSSNPSRSGLAAVRMGLTPQSREHCQPNHPLWDNEAHRNPSWSHRERKVRAHPNPHTISTPDPSQRSIGYLVSALDPRLVGYRYLSERPGQKSRSLGSISPRWRHTSIAFVHSYLNNGLPPAHVWRMIRGTRVSVETIREEMNDVVVENTLASLGLRYSLWRVSYPFFSLRAISLSHPNRGSPAYLGFLTPGLPI